MLLERLDEALRNPCHLSTDGKRACALLASTVVGQGRLLLRRKVAQVAFGAILIDPRLIFATIDKHTLEDVCARP